MSSLSLWPKNDYLGGNSRWKIVAKTFRNTCLLMRCSSKFRNSPFGRKHPQPFLAWHPISSISPETNTVNDTFVDVQTKLYKICDPKCVFYCVQLIWVLVVLKIFDIEGFRLQNNYFLMIFILRIKNELLQRTLSLLLFFYFLFFFSIFEGKK